MKKVIRKKIVMIGLFFLLAGGALSSCAGGSWAERWAEVTAKNEIMSYKKMDKDKKTLFVSVTGNIFINQFCEAFEAENTDVQVVILDVTGGNANRHPVNDYLEKGHAPDIMFMANNMVSKDMVVEKFVDLSNYEAVNQYQTEALNRNAINGKVYLLPGPSKVDSIIYNKTLFQQYGWKVPETLEDFIDICVQIQEDSKGEIESWNPNAKYSNEFNVVMQGFLYEELFAGVENRTWYHDFCKGNQTFSGHMEPMYDTLQTMIDKKILREEHFTYSATTRGKEFADGKIAMINFPITIYDNENYKYGYLPYPGKSKETSYMSDFFTFGVGVVKKEYSKEEIEVIERFINYLSSGEGQKELIGESMMISNVKNAPLNNAEYLTEIQSVINDGRMFERLDFADEQGVSLAGGFREDALAMVLGEKSAADCIEYADRSREAVSTIQPLPARVLAKVTEDFSILELSFYYADMYREKAGAEIGLIVNNLAYRGNLYRIFQGELTENDLTVMKPRSFENDSTLVRVKMTGTQILEALNHPVGSDREADAVYAYSGLKCEIAPWNPLGEKYLSVKLADGTAIEDDKIYTVAFWDGTVYDKYITEKEKQLEGTFEEILMDKLLQDESLTPVKDGRVKLVWK